MNRIIAAVATLLIAALPSVSFAGSSQASGPILPREKVAAFADDVERELAARDVRVAIVARVGRDPSTLPDGIHYTHVACWALSTITHGDGRTSTGYRAYNLYQLPEDPAASQLVEDSPGDFFAGAQVLDAGIIIPKPALQAKLLTVITGPAYGSLHNARYALLANPLSGEFQNCTEHTLDVLVASLYDTPDRVRIKANIAAHFEPQPVALGGLKRLLAPALSSALVTTDHGDEVRTATFGTIGRFMQRYDLAQDVYRVTANPDRSG